MNIPEELILKYNKPTPRYTSYPPANYFHTGFTPADYREAVVSSNGERPRNISIYIHIPFCPKMCHFCGCNTQFNRDRQKLIWYVEAVKKEIGMVGQLLDPSRRVSQVHWGGGTPNALPVELVAEIMEVIGNNFRYTENPEIAIECHPAMLTQSYVDQLIIAGFNRFSLGIQDFRQDVLDNVNRDAPKVPVKEIVGWIRSHNNTGVNLDFIYGLPYQTEKSFSETIEQAVEIAPDRLVTFSYAHVPWIKKAQKILEVRGLPQAGEKLAMFSAGHRILTGSGYTAIGLDHFARAEDELSIALKNRKLHRNFQGYCTRETTGQVYAFGATGISQLESVYAQNRKETNRYVELINSGQFPVEKGYRLTLPEKIVRHVITEIMCNTIVSLDETAAFYQQTTDEVKAAIAFDEAQFDDLVADGLLRIDQGTTFRVTETGMFFIRNIAARFDPTTGTTEKRFSNAL